MYRVGLYSLMVVIYLGLGCSSEAFGVAARSPLMDVSLRSSNSYVSMMAFPNPIGGLLSKLRRKKCAPLKATTTEAPAASPVKKVEGKSLLQTLKVGSFFALWYALNIGYNIYNKKVLNAVPTLTWTVALLQLALGLLYILPVWALRIRKTPELSLEEIKTLIPVTILHTLTHIGAVISLGAGAVSFTHIVKAAEPAVSALLNAVFLNSFLPLPVYLSLVPVMGGVAMASLTELSFTWLSFGSAMLSNVASASRGIVGKLQMGKSIGKNMDATNLYAVMTILATITLAPFALAKEGKLIKPVVEALISSGKFKPVAIQTVLSGLYYYLYNEVAFLCLDNVAPVTHALGNTIKRVVIILTSVLFLGSKMSTQGAIGSAIAILGVLLYSIAKNTFK